MMIINKKFVIIFLSIFLLEVFIALFIKDHFIRPFIGDMLVILLIYFLIRSFFPIKSAVKLSAGIFLFACVIEGCQYFELLKLLHLGESTFLSILLGSTFDWLDILAYTAGALVIPVINIKEKTTCA